MMLVLLYEVNALHKVGVFEAEFMDNWLGSKLFVPF